MRNLLIAGNWKMNLSKAETGELVSALAEQYGSTPVGVEIAVFPPNVYLDIAAQCLADSSIGLGAQNMHDQAVGAFTGEVSAAMLLDIGCRYVILGHSERRALMGETDILVNKKAVTALASGLIPVICMGESLEQRESGQTRQVISLQFEHSLEGMDASQITKSVIAYEPVWAIGTGKVATPAQAEEVHDDLRKLLAKRYNPDVANQVQILYGGSVKPDNARELMEMPNVDGALVGGASLKTDSFGGIISAAVEMVGQ